MTRQLFVVGIDALDYEFLTSHLDQLPTFKKLTEQGTLLRTQSVFPPDSTTAWATIFTSKNPGRHGVVDFLDPLEKAAKLSSEEQTAEGLQGDTFWDYLGDEGRRVAVLFPHMGFPPWDVNGVMVGRSTIDEDVRATPHELFEDEELGRYNVLKGFPGRGDKEEEFLDAAHDLVRREYEFTADVASRESWDMVFTYSSTLDLLEHFYWPTDPETGSKEELLRIHQTYDEQLRRLISEFGDEYEFLVISDHGHGPRPTRLLNINEILREAGLLATPSGGGRVWSEGLKHVQRLAAKTVAKFNLEQLAQEILKYVPQSREVFTNPVYFDPEESEAYLTDFSGIKAYSYGGIQLNPDLPPDRATSVREQVIALLSEVTDPTTGEEVFHWVRPREEVIEGQHEDVYPDILFHMKQGYGAGREVNVPHFTDASDVNFVPGTHRIDTGVCLATELNGFRSSNADQDLLDLAPTILDFLGLPAPDDYEGESLLHDDRG